METYSIVMCLCVTDHSQSPQILRGKVNCGSQTKHNFRLDGCQPTCGGVVIWSTTLQANGCNPDNCIRLLFKKIVSNVVSLKEIAQYIIYPKCIHLSNPQFSNSSICSNLACIFLIKCPGCGYLFAVNNNCNGKYPAVVF